MSGFLQFLRALLACLIVAAGTILALRAGWFDPVPYDEVILIEARRVPGNHLFVQLAYTKTDERCEYERGQAFAVLPGGERYPVEFTPIRTGGQGEQRFPGDQVLRWRVAMERWQPDQVEVWTRHDCNGTRVDRLMASIEVPE